MTYDDFDARRGGAVAEPLTCVVVIDETLAPGLAESAAALMAVTLGTKVPVLTAPRATLRELLR